MNLCGGIDGVSEQELVLEIPDDEFNVTSRRKKSSSTPSRRNKSIIDQSSLRTQTSSNNRSSTRSSRGSGTMPSSQSSTTTSAASMLNPVSRHDFEKLKSRHRSNPLRGMKSSSILMKKLESGFNLVREKQYTVESR